ncbi:hypothetical protein VTK73DRAFT_9558 [Phialemonium thermophilum]|uniref:tRNA (uracil-O(2)-)-methyltransferase n=1 Tax=Phialemonium thermophilum TaxID=223376 RepID=A0ABR3W1V9_9PEZI
MGFTPKEFGKDAEPLIFEVPSASSRRWSPVYWHPCAFGPGVFADVMSNLVKNPNINTTWLFRADIVREEDGGSCTKTRSAEPDEPAIPRFDGFTLKRSLVRRLIPRNTTRDKPLDQTCLTYETDSGDGQEQRSLVVYLPHASSVDDMPFYHPDVQGIAFLHAWNAATSEGTVSLSYLFFPGTAMSAKLMRTALNLLSVIQKHGNGRLTGYVKRVHHDLVVPQAPFQNRYTALKEKYAKQLVKNWAESTDPKKHVFEDLGIAAFLIELWQEMYADRPFPGFVDIGCGNGLLVYILNREGYWGWGFDARSRKSWQLFNNRVDIGGCEQDALKQLVLVPSVVKADEEASTTDGSSGSSADGIHDGTFAPGTFIISNHADELTPWTPVLAALSHCPFLMIPCCSHNLTGAKFRPPPPRDKTKSSSTYSSLLAWVEDLGRDCGWALETEMLRIPSTRNAALVGRKASREVSREEVEGIIERYGGTEGFYANAIKLANTVPRGH